MSNNNPTPEPRDCPECGGTGTTTEPSAELTAARQAAEAAAADELRAQVEAIKASHNEPPATIRRHARR